MSCLPHLLRVKGRLDPFSRVGYGEESDVRYGSEPGFKLLVGSIDVQGGQDLGQKKPVDEGQWKEKNDPDVRIPGG